MVEYSQKWHNGTSSRTRCTKISDGLAAIQAQLNNLGREIKKLNEKVYATQVGCELCKGPHYTMDCPQKEEGKTLEDAYYTYLEELLIKFMAESAKTHEENSIIIKEIRASTDAAIRNQGASNKTMEIQIGQMSKVLQERGFGSLPSSTKTNPRDQVKSILTTKADFSEILYIGYGPYAILDVYDHTLPHKEKDPGSFTLPCFIHNIYFDKALVDLGASVSVMPFSTYTNLGLGNLSHTRYKYVNADLFPSLSINLMYKSFYYSIIKNKDEGKSHARTLIDIPVFVESFSIITCFTNFDDNDITKDVVLGMRFCKKYSSCQLIMKKFSHENECEQIDDE
ncbi:hypothetical protein Tco_0523670 [Tanacetum coccineum]